MWGKEKQREGLTCLKTKRHGLSNDPAHNDKKWGHTKRNLDTGANRNPHRKIHLVPKSNNHSSDVLGSIADNGNQNQANKGLADVGFLDNVVDAPDEVLGAKRNENSHHDEDNAGCNGTHAWFFGFDSIFGSLLHFRVKQVAVGAKLEDEVEDVEDQEDNSGASG